MEIVAIRPASTVRPRDLLELGKPRLSLLVLFTSAVGLWVAPTGLSPARAAVFLLATASLVAAANTLNSWLERDVDARMLRTRGRPLPTGRVEPRTALAYGVTLALLSLLLLGVSTNLRTTSLGLVACVVYVAIYTPLKRITPWALPIGAIPGAIPPLMGWTAATGRLATPGWFLFGILFLWQLPHFVAIAIHVAEDYRRGGMQVLPVALGERRARLHLLAQTLALVAFSLAAVPLGLAGSVYAGVAAALGAGFLYFASLGVPRVVGPTWARSVFAYSLIYLPLLLATLVLDAG